MNDTINSDKKGDRKEGRKELLRFRLIHKNVTVLIAINKSGITFKYSIWSNMLNSLTIGINGCN